MNQWWSLRAQAFHLHETWGSHAPSLLWAVERCFNGLDAPGLRKAIDYDLRVNELRKLEEMEAVCSRLHVVKADQR